MKKFILIFLLYTGMSPQPGTEKKILNHIQQIIKQEGLIKFSDLYNSQSFNDRERVFLGRLYEIFFAIPDFLQSKHATEGKIPSISELAEQFAITKQSVDLLLTVMETDSRMPSLFRRDPQSGELQLLKLNNIRAFIAKRGTSVRLTQWKGALLPPFKLITFEGETLTSQDLVGQNVLLYFWFSGCPPCIKLAPLLSDLGHQYSSSNLRLIGINADRVLGLSVTDQDRQSYLDKHQLDFLNVHLDTNTHQSFGNMQMFPTLFIVGADGRVFRHLVNYQSREALDQILSKLLAREF